MIVYSSRGETNNVFDFKIRDKLKKMPEYKFLRKEYSCTSQILSDKGRKVTLDMVIDMIVYSSRGDKELAIRGLRTNEMEELLWFHVRVLWIKERIEQFKD